MKRICHIVDALNVGGLEKTLVSIILGAGGYEHCVLCLREEGLLAAQLRAAGVDLEAFHFSGRLRLSQLWRLSGLLKRRRPDVVHCHGLYPSIWGRAAAWAAGVPVRIHHAQNVYYGLGPRDRMKLKLLAPITSRTIAVSRAVKDCLVRFIGIPAGQITVIYNSSPDLFSAEPSGGSAIRQQYEIAGSDLLIGCIGRLEKHKGHGFVIEAVARCKAQGAACKAMIVGDGPAAGELKTQAAGLGLEKEVVFTGRVAEVKPYLAAMDVFVQPSTMREGLPLALAEAASAGLPLVATPVGGNAEVVADGSNGFIAAAGDAAALAESFLRLAINPELRRRMGERSRSIWQESFSSTTMIKALEQLYEHEISKHRHP